MDNAIFWCGCQQAFEGEAPEKCKLHGDTVERIVEHVEVELPTKPKTKSKTKPSKR